MNKIKFFKFLKENGNLQLSILIFIILLFLSFKYSILKYFMIISIMNLIFNLMKGYFKIERLVFVPFMLFCLDIASFYFLRLGIISIFLSIIAVGVMIYAEYHNYKTEGIRNAIEFLGVYYLLKLFLTIINFIL